MAVGINEIRKTMANAPVHTNSPQPSHALTRRYSLAIGIDHYSSPLFSSLQFAAKDAQAVNESLVRLGFNSFPPLLGMSATRAAILESFLRSEAAMKPGDLFLVYIASAMATVNDNGTSSVMIIPSDIQGRDDFQASDIGSNAISINDIVSALSNKSGLNVVLVLDGSFGLTGIDPEMYRRSQKLGSFVIVTGTGNIEIGFESLELRGSIFAQKLVDVLDNLGRDRTGPVTLSEVFTQLAARMQAESQKLRVNQTPQMLDLWGSGDLILRTGAGEQTSTVRPLDSKAPSP
jgi:hypothetical protein